MGHAVSAGSPRGAAAADVRRGAACLHCTSCHQHVHFTGSNKACACSRIKTANGNTWCMKSAVHAPAESSKPLAAAGCSRPSGLGADGPEAEAPLAALGGGGTALAATAHPATAVPQQGEQAAAPAVLQPAQLLLGRLRRHPRHPFVTACLGQLKHSLAASIAHFLLNPDALAEPLPTARGEGHVSREAEPEGARACRAGRARR